MTQPLYENHPDTYNLLVALTGDLEEHFPEIEEALDRVIPQRTEGSLLALINTTDKIYRAWGPTDNSKSDESFSTDNPHRFFAHALEVLDEEHKELKEAYSIFMVTVPDMVPKSIETIVRFAPQVPADIAVITSDKHGIISMPQNIAVHAVNPGCVVGGILRAYDAPLNRYLMG